jgi:hypothetical protein
VFACYAHKLISSKQNVEPGSITTCASRGRKGVASSSSSSSSSSDKSVSGCSHSSAASRKYHQGPSQPAQAVACCSPPLSRRITTTYRHQKNAKLQPITQGRKDKHPTWLASATMSCHDAPSLPRFADMGVHQTADDPALATPPHKVTVKAHSHTHIPPGWRVQPCPAMTRHPCLGTSGWLVSHALSQHCA